MQKAGATGDDRDQLLTIVVPVGQGALGRPAMAHEGSIVMVRSRAIRLSRRAYGQVWGQKEARPRPGQTAAPLTQSASRFPSGSSLRR